MTKITFGLICGMAFGLFAVLIMIPMPESDKRKKSEAMIGAFIERFMIGFLIPNVDLGGNYIISGLIISSTFSLSTAIITRAYLPILVIGTLGGLIIGVVSNLIIK